MSTYAYETHLERDSIYSRKSESELLEDVRNDNLDSELIGYVWTYLGAKGNSNTIFSIDKLATAQSLPVLLACLLKTKRPKILYDRKNCISTLKIASGFDDAAWTDIFSQLNTTVDDIANETGAEKPLTKQFIDAIKKLMGIAPDEPFYPYERLIKSPPDHCDKANLEVGYVCVCLM